MSYASGLQAGLAAGEMLGKGISGIAGGYNRSKIAAELNKEYYLDDGVQEMTSEADALAAVPGGAPATQPPVDPAMRPTGLVVPSEAPPAPGTQMPPQFDKIAAGDVLGQARDNASKVQQPVQMPAAKRRVDPMQDYKRYSAAARVAAEQGDLELTEAYKKMGQAAYENGAVASAFRAVSLMQKGDPSGVAEFMTHVVPTPYRYGDFKLNPETGEVIGKVIGDKGESSEIKFTADDIYSSAQYMLANRESLAEMFKLRAEADKEAWNRKKDTAELALKEGTLRETARRNDIMEVGMLTRAAGGGGAGGAGGGRAGREPDPVKAYSDAVELTGSDAGAAFFTQLMGSRPGMDVATATAASKKFAAGDFKYTVDPATGKPVQATLVGDRSVTVTTPGGRVADPIESIRSTFPADTAERVETEYKSSVKQFLEGLDYNGQSFQQWFASLPAAQKQQVAQGYAQQYGSWVAEEMLAPLMGSRAGMRQAPGFAGRQTVQGGVVTAGAPTAPLFQAPQIGLPQAGPMPMGQSGRGLNLGAPMVQRVPK